MTFGSLFPNLQGWVSNLGSVWPGSIVSDSVWLYAVFGAFHLVFLGLLGGAVILLNMRLMGVGMVSQTPAKLENDLKPYLHIGVIGVLVTGIIIGWANADKLYHSTAFFVKMVALVGAIIFSYGVTNIVARGEGEMPTKTKVAAIIAFLLWLVSMGVFSTTQGTNPGSTHMIAAGYLILFGFASTRIKYIAAGVLAVLILTAYVWAYEMTGLWENYDTFMAIHKLLSSLAAVILVGLLGYEIFVGRTDTDTNAFSKLVALFSILTWVTVAAGGRWIGLSP